MQPGDEFEDITIDDARFTEEERLQEERTLREQQELFEFQMEQALDRIQARFEQGPVPLRFGGR